ncbi:MAG: hypothetical protein PUG17_04145 [Stecheria intestinalis]|nr:hypothetical protein [Stecheria intestinalis]
MKGKTKTGFEWEVNAEAIDNWELVEILTEADKGSSSALIQGMKMVLGDEGYSALKEHVRGLSKDGIVHSTSMSSEFLSFLNSINEGKN